MEHRESNLARLVRTLEAILFIVVMSAPAAAAESLTAADRAVIVEKLATAIEEGYVLEEKGRDVATQLRRMAVAERFTGDDPTELADALQRALRDISGDVHFRVSYGSMAGAIGGPQRGMVQVPAGEPGTPADGGRRMVRVPPGAPETPAAGPVRVPHLWRPVRRRVETGGKGQRGGLSPAAGFCRRRGAGRAERRRKSRMAAGG